MHAEDRSKPDIVLYPSRWKMALLALVGLLFVWCAPLLWPRPALVIDALGVTDHASAVGAGFIGWEEIESVAVSSFGESRFLVIVPHDARAILARQPPLKRVIMAINSGLVGSPIALPGTLSLPLEEVAAHLQARLEERAFYGGG